MAYLIRRLTTISEYATLRAQLSEAGADILASGRAPTTWTSCSSTRWSASASSSTPPAASCCCSRTACGAGAPGSASASTRARSWPTRTTCPSRSTRCATRRPWSATSARRGDRPRSAGRPPAPGARPHRAAARPRAARSACSSTTGRGDRRLRQRAGQPGRGHGPLPGGRAGQRAPHGSSSTRGAVTSSWCATRASTSRSSLDMAEVLRAVVERGSSAPRHGRLRHLRGRPGRRTSAPARQLRERRVRRGRVGPATSVRLDHYASSAWRSAACGRCSSPRPTTRGSTRSERDEFVALRAQDAARASRCASANACWRSWSSSTSAKVRELSDDEVELARHHLPLRRARRSTRRGCSTSSAPAPSAGPAGAAPAAAAVVRRRAQPAARHGADPQEVLDEVARAAVDLLHARTAAVVSGTGEYLACVGAGRWPAARRRASSRRLRPICSSAAGRPWGPGDEEFSRRRRRRVSAGIDGLLLAPLESESPQPSARSWSPTSSGRVRRRGRAAGRHAGGAGQREPAQHDRLPARARHRRDVPAGAAHGAAGHPRHRGRRAVPRRHRSGARRRRLLRPGHARARAG